MDTMNMDKIDLHLPVIALKDMTIMPGMMVHFDITREKSIHAVEKSMTENQKIFLITQKDSSTLAPGQKDVYQVGTIADIKQVMKLPGGVIRILVQGIEKANLVNLYESEEMLLAGVSEQSKEAQILDEQTEKAMVESLHKYIQAYATVNKNYNKELVKQLLKINKIQTLLERISIDFPMDYLSRQKMLEASSIQENYELISGIIVKETEVLTIKSKLERAVKQSVDQNQKEYVLREQLKVIHEELGDGSADSQIAEYREAVDALKASKEIKEKIRKEINRFQSLASSSAESSVARGYIETLLELPWDKASKDNKEINHAYEILSKDHYGLEKVKERIIEFLAVRKVAKTGEAPVLCLVGPPGTGKTSIAKSIAKALSKKYVRISLGGVRDEAEIRGHRRTYIGAMPGRIIEGIKSAGVKNPVMLLDEIDKISSDYKGDTASALLEVLDGEQNNRFRDHYIEIPVDLSEILFIATANDLSTVSRPLLDRMEIIEVGSYTENEKLHIVKEHLLNKQIDKNGLHPESISISEKALKKVITAYTREAGVRDLERNIAKICRKVIKDTLMKSEIKGGKATRKKTQDEQIEEKPVRITEKTLEKYLGPEKYLKDEVNKQDDIGIVRGLAWTRVGGDTLQIEVNTMAGKGMLKLTGRMGDVMKESAIIALSYVRAVLTDELTIGDYFEKHDIHVHIPQGAVPKDGPSAGVTMATAIYSAVTGKYVRANIAMTGEITLRGKVLPIGGLKEKLIAAKAAGITKVLVPAKNKRDVDELSSEVTSDIEIVYMEDMTQVIEQAVIQ